MDPVAALRAQIIVEIRRSVRVLRGPEGIDVSTPTLAYQRLRDLGADSHLLATVGSWGDTLSDADVLQNLQEWNKRQRAGENHGAN